MTIEKGFMLAVILTLLYLMIRAWIVDDTFDNISSVIGTVVLIFAGSMLVVLFTSIPDKTPKQFSGRIVHMEFSEGRFSNESEKLVYKLGGIIYVPPPSPPKPTWIPEQYRIYVANKNEVKVWHVTKETYEHAAICQFVTFMHNE